MQQPHQAARVADGLAPPHDRLVGALARVFLVEGVLGQAVALVGGADGEDQQHGQRGPRDEGQQLRVGQGVDVVDAEALGHAQLVDERGHELRVGLERDEGHAAALDVGVRDGRHGLVGLGCGG